MRSVTYLSLDSIQEGVGASQVLAYISRISHHRKVILVSYEKSSPDPDTRAKLLERGIDWIPIPFGNYGLRGGFSRVWRMRRYIDPTSIVHARSTAASISALSNFHKLWIWDCRSLQADQRRALSSTRRITLEFVLLRFSELILARVAKNIIVITSSVVPVLVDR